MDHSDRPSTTCQKEDFVRSIDPGLLEYKNELFRLAVTSFQTLQFLRPWEVRSMEIPEVYKRMLISKILDLQTPETKKKMRNDVHSPGGVSLSGGLTQPKKLCFGSDDNTSTAAQTFREADYDRDVNEETRESTSSSSGSVAKRSFIETEICKLEDERDTINILLIHKKNELKKMRTPPLEPLAPLPAHGGVLNRFLCDKCHRRGHKANGNRGGESCPYDACLGFKQCGNIQKHKDHKMSISELEKEISTIEKELQKNEERTKSLNTFLNTNTTNFVRAVRPQLQLKKKYIGKEGTQQLQKDIRYMKIATNGKIPTNLTTMQANELEELIKKGKMQVSEKFEEKDTDAAPRSITESRDTTRAPTCTPGHSGPVYSTVSTPQQQQQTAMCTWPALYYQYSMFPQYSPYMWSPGTGPTPNATLTSPPDSETNSTAAFPPLPKEKPPSPLPPLPLEGFESPQ